MNRYEIENFAKRAASRYLNDGAALDESISEMAGQNNWNREQIKRVVEVTNTVVNGELVKKARATGQDPRVSFTLAKSDNVFASVIDDSDAAVGARLDASSKLADMFKVAKAKPVTEKVASSPAPVNGSWLKGSDVAKMYLSGPDGEVEVTRGQLIEATDELDSLTAAGNAKTAAIRESFHSSVDEIGVIAQGLIHDGLTPATLATIIKRAGVRDIVETAALRKIAESACEMQKVAGVSQLDGKSIIDNDHEMLVMLRQADKAISELADVDSVKVRIKEARARVSADMKKEGHVIKVSFAPSQVGLKAPSDGGGVLGKAVSGLGLLSEGHAAMGAGKASTEKMMGAQRRHAKVVGPKRDNPSEWQPKQSMVNVSLPSNPSMSAVLKGAIGVGAAFAVAGQLGNIADAASSGVGSIFERRRRDKLFEKLLVIDPALKQNPRSREYFDLVMTYAPSLGDHPTAIGDCLRRQLQYPMTSTEFLPGVADMQSTITMSSKREPGAFSTGARMGTEKATGAWFPSPDKDGSTPGTWWNEAQRKSGRR